MPVKMTLLEAAAFERQLFCVVLYRSFYIDRDPNDVSKDYALARIACLKLQLIDQSK